MKKNGVLDWDSEKEESIQNQQEVFTQGSKTETVEKALASMKELFQKYEDIIGDSREASKKRINLSLYEFPKMIDAIKAVDSENIIRSKKGELEFDLEKSNEYKKMEAYGLKYYDIVMDYKKKVEEAIAYTKEQTFIK